MTILNKKKKTKIPELEVYLLYHKLDKPERKGNFNQFFSRLDNIDSELSDNIVFLDLTTVMQYSRFIDANHAILKASVPHAAIEGRSQGLTLRKGFVKKSHIHGCFPGWSKGMLFIQNPYFGQKIPNKSPRLGQTNGSDVN